MYMYIQYANRSYIQNIGPEFCVQECDIARPCEGYMRSDGHKTRVLYALMQYIGPISILYTIYCMMVTSLA